MRIKRTSGLSSAFGPIILFSGLLGAGCVGYLTGSYDIEMQRLRTIIAELEAKNAALVEECIGLRERLRKSERAGQDTSASFGRAQPPDFSGSDAGPGATD